MPISQLLLLAVEGEIAKQKLSDADIRWQDISVGKNYVLGVACVVES